MIISLGVMEFLHGMNRWGIASPTHGIHGSPGIDDRLLWRTTATIQSVCLKTTRSTKSTIVIVEEISVCLFGIIKTERHRRRKSRNSRTERGKRGGFYLSLSASLTAKLTTITNQSYCPVRGMVQTKWCVILVSRLFFFEYLSHVFIFFVVLI